jgi:hypothetical protein
VSSSRIKKKEPSSGAPLYFTQDNKSKKKKPRSLTTPPLFTHSNEIISFRHEIHQDNNPAKGAAAISDKWRKPLMKKPLNRKKALVSHAKRRPIK